MRTVRVHAPGDARIDDIAEPTVDQPGDVKVRITAAGICGTDLWLYANAPVPPDYRHPAFGDTGPHVMGHEMAGTVAEVGSDVTDLVVGDLVAVRPLVTDHTCEACLRGDTNLCRRRGFLGIHGGGGGFSQYVVTSRRQIHPLPSPFTAELGALVETLATCWQAVHSVPLDPEDSVLVVGAGPIGLGIVMCLQARGISDILISALGPARLAAAVSLGTHAIDPHQTDLLTFVRESTGRKGVAASFDAAGAPGGVFQAQFDALRDGGHLVVVGEYHDTEQLDLTSLMRTGKHVHGSFAYTESDFDAVIAAVADGRLQPASLITSVIPLEETISRGLDGLRDGGRETQVKVVVGLGSGS